MSKTRVLILGSTGTLGSMVWKYLSANPTLDVVGTTRDKNLQDNQIHFEANEYLVSDQYDEALTGVDYIINCLGVIKPYCKDDDLEGVRNAIAINTTLPHRLSAFCKAQGTKVIQVATDCVYSGLKGQYSERDPHDPTDVYGKTKSLGEVFDKSILVIRCSFIGPERKTKSNLLEWFLSHPEGAQLNGFAHHQWNGATTLQCAQLFEMLLTSEDDYDKLITHSHLHHFTPNSTVSKYELLKIFADVFKRDYTVNEVDDIGDPVDRTLSTRFDLLSGLVPQMDMRKAVQELHSFMEANRDYFSAK